MFIVTGATDGMEHPTTMAWEPEEALKALQGIVDANYDPDMMICEEDDEYLRILADFKSEAESILRSAREFLATGQTCWTYGARESNIYGEEYGCMVDWFYTIVRY